MKTAIIYATHHGTTQLVASLIDELLVNDFVDYFNIQDVNDIDLVPYQRVIIGGSIHAGTIQKSISDFCTANINELMNKQVGLFICAMNEQQWEDELEKAFPSLLREHADSVRIMGGEFNVDKMNVIERFLVKRIAGVDMNVSNILHEQIVDFVNDLEEAHSVKAF